MINAVYMVGRTSWNGQPLLTHLGKNCRDAQARREDLLNGDITLERIGMSMTSARPLQTKPIT